MKSRRRSRVKKFVLLVALSCALVFVFTLALRWRTSAAGGGRVYDEAREVPAESEPRIAIVFGAGVWRGGEPSPILYDRIATAAALYREGKARTLLVSGDNRFKEYNEPAVMRETLKRMGVPASAIVEDFAGRRTYDTCYRAREIFGVRRAVLVTQGFHLDRALYLCNSLGVDSTGLRADRRQYPRAKYFWWSLRELPATLAAWGDLHLLRPTPVLGEKIQIQ